MIHIVPAVPPAINGLGSYCHKLWEQWPQPRVPWRCLALNVPPGARERWPEVVLELFAPSERGLLNALGRSNETVVLHYAGYGYQPKGSPLWLPRALRRWKRESGGRLVVMFHELYSSGRRWSSSFWLYPVAKSIVRDLVRTSDVWATSCPQYEQQLKIEMHADPTSGFLLPIGPDIAPPLTIDRDRAWPLHVGRRLKVVVFGQANTRLWALQAHENLLRQLHREGAIESILMMGSQPSPTSKEETRRVCKRICSLDNSVWRERYDLTPNEISQELLKQDIGLVANNPGMLTKSLVYAALCAHGVAVIAACGDAGRLTSQAQGEACFVNFDLHSEEARAALHDVHFVAGVRWRIAQRAQETLNWNVIGQGWARALATVASLEQ